MSHRMIWKARVILVGANGQSGTIDLSAENLVTVKEIQAFLGKAITMAETLQREHREEGQSEQRQWPRAV